MYPYGSDHRVVASYFEECEVSISMSHPFTTLDMILGPESKVPPVVKSGVSILVLFHSKQLNMYPVGARIQLMDGII